MESKALASVSVVSINDPMDRILKGKRQLAKAIEMFSVSINDPMDRILKAVLPPL